MGGSYKKPDHLRVSRLVGRLVPIVLLMPVLLLSVQAGAREVLSTGGLPLGALDSAGKGWAELLKIDTLVGFAINASSVAILTALIAFHPYIVKKCDTLVEAELPKTLFIYALIGMIAGFLVDDYGAIIGFVIFGIGGLMRFRTNVGSTKDTGRVILVTLVGLCIGLQIPHVAVLSTATGWIMIYFLERTNVFKVVVRFDNMAALDGSCELYRQALLASGGTVLSEKKGGNKPQVEFVFRTSHATCQADFESAIAAGVPEEGRGRANWELI